MFNPATDRVNLLFLLFKPLRNSWLAKEPAWLDAYLTLNDYYWTIIHQHAHLSGERKTHKIFQLFSIVWCNNLTLFRTINELDNIPNLSSLCFSITSHGTVSPHSSPSPLIPSLATDLRHYANTYCEPCRNYSRSRLIFALSIRAYITIKSWTFAAPIRMGYGLLRLLLWTVFHWTCSLVLSKYHMSF